MAESFLAALGILVAIGLGVVLKIHFFPRKLSRKNFEVYKKRIENTKKLAPEHAILESHKLLVAAISTISGKGKNESAAKIINRVAQKFPNQARFWDLHRVRNEVAHNPDFKVARGADDTCRREFVRALESLT